MSCPRKGYYQDSAQWILKYQCNRKRETKTHKIFTYDSTTKVQMMQ